jgi:hypothetical protein
MPVAASTPASRVVEATALPATGPRRRPPKIRPTRGSRAMSTIDANAPFAAQRTSDSVSTSLILKRLRPFVELSRVTMHGCPPVPASTRTRPWLGAVHGQALALLALPAAAGCLRWCSRKFWAALAGSGSAAARSVGSGRCRGRSARRTRCPRDRSAPSTSSSSRTAAPSSTSLATSRAAASPTRARRVRAHTALPLIAAVRDGGEVTKAIGRSGGCAERWPAAHDLIAAG